MSIGERIKVLREQKGISQTDLAMKTSISKQTLYKYENDIITNIPSDKIELIAIELGTTPQYLMGWDNKQVAPVQNSDFDDFELGLIKQFRAADTETQEMIIKLLAFSAKMKKEQNDME